MSEPGGPHSDNSDLSKRDRSPVIDTSFESEEAENSPDSGGEKPSVAESQKQIEEALKTKAEIIKEKNRSVQEKIRKIRKGLLTANRDLLRVDEEIQNIEPRPVRSAVAFGGVTVLDYTQRVFRASGRKLDHAGKGVETWLNKVIEKNFKKAFQVPVLGWLLKKVTMYKPMESLQEIHEREERRLALVAKMRKEGKSEKEIERALEAFDKKEVQAAVAAAKKAEAAKKLSEKAKVAEKAAADAKNAKTSEEKQKVADAAKKALDDAKAEAASGDSEKEE